MAKTQRSTS